MQKPVRSIMHNACLDQESRKGKLGDSSKWTALEPIRHDARVLMKDGKESIRN
jgi:hypothetical protein